MISKVKGIILVVIVSLSLASIMMPFTVYADTITASNIVGVNVELVGSTILEHRTETIAPNIYNYYYKQYTYKAVIELDNSYVGVIGVRVQGNYYDMSPNPNQTIRTETLNKYRKIYVNGNKAEMTFVISSWYSSTADPIIYRADGTSPYITLEDSNVSKYEDLDSIDQIIDILSDIYQNSNDIEGLSTNQLTELQTIVSNTSLANQYLDTLTEIRNYNIPFESYNVALYLLNRHGDKVVDLYQYNRLTYPLFYFTERVPVVRMYFNSNKSYKFIFLSAGNLVNKERFLNFFDIPSILSFVSIEQLSQSIYLDNVSGYNIYSVELNCSTSGFDYIYYKYPDRYFTAFYMNSTDRINVSTEFALQFGLSNQLLNDIHVIANGTTQSNSAASDLENEASEYSDIADDVIDVEEGLTSNFETSVNQIDLNTGLNGFGGNFMTSATWVRTQFDRLTENTPYGSLVVYGLTLGFVLLMLGKVLL